MPLLERMRARLCGPRPVACRTDHGFRTAITTVPLADGKGVRLDTTLGGLVLTPLEVGQLRERLRIAVITSGQMSTEDEQ